MTRAELIKRLKECYEYGRDDTGMSVYSFTHTRELYDLLPAIIRDLEGSETEIKKLIRENLDQVAYLLTGKKLNENIAEEAIKDLIAGLKKGWHLK